MGSGCGLYKSFGSPATGPILTPPLLFHLTSVGQGQWGAGEVIDEGAWLRFKGLLRGLFLRRKVRKEV